jgi:hypothetical protein
LAIAPGWRESLRSVVAHWDQVLLSALGCCELLMAAGAAPLAMAVGAIGGSALVLSAWLRTVPRIVRIGLVVLGTLPFAAVGWVAVVPILLVIVAAPLARHPVR